MENEEYKKAAETISDNRTYRAKEVAFIKEARKQLKPFCSSCFKHDTDKGTVRNLADYTNNIKIGEHEIKQRKTDAIIGAMFDYNCPVGHRLSMEFTNDEVKKIRVTEAAELAKAEEAEAKAVKR